MSKSSSEDLSNTADLIIDQFKNEMFQEYSEGRASNFKNKQRSGISKEECLGLKD